MALDEKNSNAVIDAMKDLSLRKSYLEDNLRLADEIKVLHDEEFTFSSSFLGLLADYGIRPTMLDASSISNSMKRLYNQLHWRIKSSQMSNSHVHQQYSQPSHDTPIPSSFGNQRLDQDDDIMDVKDISTYRNPEMYYTSPSTRDIQTPPTFFHPGYKTDKQIERRPSFKFSVPDKHQTNAFYDLGGEILPGVDGFQIIGDAKPGSTLRACGFPINGTSLCMFQWVRHHQNGTWHYIDGLTNPDYVVTADDVDKLIAVECTPMDENGRQGELVREFANNHNKITCDAEMQREIDGHVSEGRAMFNVLLLNDPSEVWKPATLSLKRSSYLIKINEMDKLLIEEKYSADLSIKVPYGLSTQFVLTSSDGTSYPFSTNGICRPSGAENDIRLRDTIVLTMRFFQAKVIDSKKKGKA